MQTTGDFEISESGSMSVSGKIKETESSEADILPYKDTSTMELSNADVYKELRLRGYDYGSEFRGISAADINGKYKYICRFIFNKIKLTKYKNIQYLKKKFTGKYGELIWNNNWISFLDTMLQMSILRLSGNGLRLPTRIKSITVNPLFHGKNAYTNDQDQSGNLIHVLLVHHNFPLFKNMKHMTCFL